MLVQIVSTGERYVTTAMNQKTRLEKAHVELSIDLIDYVHRLIHERERRGWEWGPENWLALIRSSPFMRGIHLLHERNR